MLILVEKGKLASHKKEAIESTVIFMAIFTLKMIFLTGELLVQFAKVYFQCRPMAYNLKINSLKSTYWKNGRERNKSNSVANQ